MNAKAGGSQWHRRPQVVGYMQTRDAGLALDSVRWICQEKHQEERLGSGIWGMVRVSVVVI